MYQQFKNYFSQLTGYIRPGNGHGLEGHVEDYRRSADQESATYSRREADGCKKVPVSLAYSVSHGHPSCNHRRSRKGDGSPFGFSCFYNLDSPGLPACKEEEKLSSKCHFSKPLSSSTFFGINDAIKETDEQIHLHRKHGDENTANILQRQKVMMERARTTHFQQINQIRDEYRKPVPIDRKRLKRNYKRYEFLIIAALLMMTLIILKLL